MNDWFKYIILFGWNLINKDKKLGQVFDSLTDNNVSSNYFASLYVVKISDNSDRLGVTEISFLK